MILPDKTYDVVAAGHICLDIIPQIPETGAKGMGELFRPGSLLNVGPCAVTTGGPVSNTGIGLAKLGCRVAFLAKVGDDEHGRIVRGVLDRHGGSEGLSVTTAAPTSYTVALAPPGIDRMFLHCPGANDAFRGADVPYDLVAQAGWFHFGYPPLMRRLYEHEGRELADIFRRAKQAGATTSLDMALPDPASPSGNAPWRAILRRVLPFVDIFLPSMEEAFFMLRREEFLKRKAGRGGGELLDHITAAECSTMAAEFLEMGAGMTALKSGHRGYYFRTGDAAALARFGAVKPANAPDWSRRELWCPALQIDRIASATGSGDSSIAGFLAAFLRGLALEDCLRTAVCTGHQNLHALDALSGIRTWDETWAMVQGQPPVVDPRITDAGWRRDRALGMWVGPNDRAAGAAGRE